MFICSQLGKGATSDAGYNSSELLMCGGGVHGILLLSLVPRCQETKDIYIYIYMRMFKKNVCCSDCVRAVVKDNGGPIDIFFKSLSSFSSFISTICITFVNTFLCRQL